MITAFLVDDEEHALTILELFLQRSGEVEVIGRSNNGFDAIRQLGELKPDVLFLDIEMPEMNGLELAEVVRNVNTDVQIVFVTAYDQYAISAFEHAAVDYLLKPLEADRLSKTIARLRHTIDKMRGAERTLAPAVGRMSVQLFGPMSVGIEGGPWLKWRTANEKELFAYLASQDEKRVHRDRLIEALWPDENYQKAKIYLHTCISLLRKNLKRIGFGEVVKYVNEGYFLDTERIDVDARFLAGRLQKLKEAEHPEAAEIEKALSYYRGPFLQEDDYLWAEQQTGAFEKSVYEWSLTLGKIRLNEREYDKAAKAAEKAIERSPYDEEAYRLLMSSYRGLGMNDRVHVVYRKLLDKLEELQVKPSDSSRMLYEEICE